MEKMKRRGKEKDKKEKGKREKNKIKGNTGGVGRQAGNRWFVVRPKFSAKERKRRTWRG